MFKTRLVKETINITDLKAYTYKKNAASMRKRGRIAVRVAKATVGVETGALKRSIHMKEREVRGVPVIRVGSSLRHAYMHHSGTRRHVIRPKKPGGILVFKGKTGLVRTKRVMHPRVRGNRYLRNALIAGARMSALG